MLGRSHLCLWLLAIALLGALCVLGLPALAQDSDQDGADTDAADDAPPERDTTQWVLPTYQQSARWLQQMWVSPDGQFVYYDQYRLLSGAEARRSFFSYGITTNVLDTETGIKIFDRSKVLTVLDVVEEKGWFWDTEVISRLLRSGFNVRQLPVRVVRSNKTSSVRFLRDTAAYLKALARYRGKLAKK